MNSSGLLFYQTKMESHLKGEFENMDEEFRSSAPEEAGQESVDNQSLPPQSFEAPQWGYYDYGPIGGPQLPKTPKPKKEKKPGRGVRALAVVMSVLFVLTAGAFAAYVVFFPTVRTGQNTERSTVEGDLFDEQATPDGDTTDGVEGEVLTNRQIYKKVEPAIVGIICYSKSVTGMQAASQGSGIVFRSDGYIVTNCHVVRDDDTSQVYDRIEVVLTTGDSYVARFIGGDRQSDLAVLKIDAQNLTTAVFGDSEKMQVGDEVVVIGNPSGMALAGSFTHGYISALKRSVYISTIGSSVEFIQTDAAINPGNSGGAMVNVYGQVIGITSAKLVQDGYEGIGFAIPIDNAKPIIESLIQNGYVTGRVQLGITYRVVSQSIADLNGIPRGLRVIDMDERSYVAKKGLQRGDIITKMDEVEVYDADTVNEALSGKKPGDTVVLTVYRVDGEGHASTVTIEAELSEKTGE